MIEKVDVQLVGGPVDGRSAYVALDDNGQPPTALPPAWLTEAWGDELDDADTDGTYELEAAAGVGPPWLYVWSPTP